MQIFLSFKNIFFTRSILILRKIRIIMRISFILFFIGTICVYANMTYGQNELVSLRIVNASLTDVFREIEKQSDYRFFYNNTVVENTGTYDLDIDNKPISAILSELFSGTNINYSMVDNYIVVKNKNDGMDTLSNKTIVQNKTITGTVFDDTGEALPGVSISIKGTTIGVVTDVNGKFSIDVSEFDAVLVFSCIGFVSREIKLNNQTNLTVQLTEDTQILDEVVVTGYTTQRKVDLTGSVASVTNKDIVVTKNENLVNMLSGKLSGVRITQRSAQPGSYDVSIDIRGYGAPLYVIDGIPRDYDYFARMDPEEIESVSVLKDGSAAIYGVRAANGVMLVTTKRGAAQTGKMNITYTGNYTLQTFLYMPKGVSVLEHMELRDERYWQDFNNNYMVRQPGTVADSEREPYLNGKPSYDWLSAVLRDVTPQQQHNLTVNGGNDRWSYFFNLGYQYQESMYKSGDLIANRWNLRSNVDVRITDRLNARFQLGAILAKNDRPFGTDWAVFKNIWLLRPDAPIYANDDPAYLNGDQVRLYNGHNMIAETTSAIRGYSINRQRRFNGTLALTYDIPGIKGLSAKALYDYSLSLPDNTSFRKVYSLYVYNEATKIFDEAVQQSPAGITRSVNINWSTNMQLGLYYSNRFRDHNVNSFLILEEQYASREDFSAYRDLLLKSEYLFAGEKNSNTDGWGGRPSDTSNQALVGQVDYGFKGKYLIDFRFRYDGSSRFPAESRWGFFPSLSIGWRISEEGFLKNNLKFLSNLKIRASYGEVGDDSAASTYPSTFVGYDIASNTRGAYYSGVFTGGVTPTSIPNPNLTWYKAKIYNLALDFALFKNKLSGSVDIFSRDRSGLLATSSSIIPGTVGANLPQENLNNDRNFGYEIELQHRNRVNALNYFVTGQMSATRSMRTDWLETPANNSYHKWKNRTSGRYNNIWWARESGGMFTSYDEIRHIFNRPVGQGTLPGDWWEVDWNGDGVIDDNDQHPIATEGLPLFNYGISTGVAWNNFDFTMNFQGSFGVYASYGEILTEALPFNGHNTLTWFMDRWHPKDRDADYFHPGTEWIPGYYPITGRDGRRSGSNAVHNASYIRLKTLELGYTLPKKVIAKVGLNNLRVYVSGYNLLTFSPLRNVDPERPGGAAADFYSYPVNRTFTFGGSLKF